MFRRLRFRFILIAMLSVFIVLGVIVSGINVISYNRTVSNADEILLLLAKNEGRFPEMDMNGSDMPEPPEVRDGRNMMHSPELAYESRFFSVLLDQNGAILNIDTGRIAAIDQDTAGEYALDVFGSNKTKGFVSDYRFLKTNEGSNVRIVFYDCGRSLDSFRGFLKTSIYISLAGMTVIFILIFLSSGRIVRPIAASYEKQKRFITDAGHEIKTPLAIINADCDVILSDGENTWAEDIKSQTKRLTELTNDLIYLAKMEEDVPAVSLQETDISRIAEDSVSSFTSMFITSDKTLSSNIEPGIILNCDAKAIRELISILLDNALKYSPEKGCADITLKRYKKTVKLYVVNDTKEPLSKDDCEHLTDRFYRQDKSRNSSTGGHGIGLSIASAVVSAHQGKLVFEPEDRKLKIKITLPLRSA